jgi:hypothetical protein
MEIITQLKRMKIPNKKNPNKEKKASSNMKNGNLSGNEQTQHYEVVKDINTTAHS